MKTQALLEAGSSSLINLTRILVPVDFSPLSKKALQYATRVAQQFGAEVTLFHAIEPEVPPAFDGFMIAPPPVSNGSSASCANRLKHLATSVRTAGVNNVRSTLRTGLPAYEIVEAGKGPVVDFLVFEALTCTVAHHFPRACKSPCARQLYVPPAPPPP